MEGIVQGVGFRPFVKTLADGLDLRGTVCNSASGVIIEIDSASEARLSQFTSDLRSKAPRAAQISSCTVTGVPSTKLLLDFQIVISAARDHHFTLISPDLAICRDCAEEIAIDSNWRYRYPFTNCTNCGPRFSITLSTPYDRANTTMRDFPLCGACKAEYTDANDRRFHAEPIACPKCGPKLSMDLTDAVNALASGQILAIKGLGGFQLVCNAFDASAVDRLRVSKRRNHKPFAVMMRDLQAAEKHCLLEDCDRHLLLSPAAPIVLVPMRPSSEFVPAVAPGLTQIGIMLPYTPLHLLLFDKSLECLVMTSGNLHEEPIVTTDEEAVSKLSPLCDRILTHNRDIFMRVDDSVVRNFEALPRILRRARGYAPGAIPLSHEVPEVLATGAELKNTFCITKGAYAIPSQHIGDLDNYETLLFFEESFRNLQSLYQAHPRLVVHDLHPDYLSTRWALKRTEPKLAVQHHHAHIASCMAENGISAPVIGVAFDGAGWGTDGKIWGGEFLLCDYSGFERAAHLRYVALPGGDRAAREGWRMAAAHLYNALGPEFRALSLPCWNSTATRTWLLIDRLLERPPIQTSSCGRLFDAVAAICGIAQQSTFEGEAAMLLEAEACLGRGSDLYPVAIETGLEPWTIDTRPMLRRIAQEIAAGRPPADVAYCFHRSVAHIVESVCSRLRERSGVNQVCLSGGVFQNFTLLSQAVSLLRQGGFQVFLHSQVPPNDGGISLGQAVIGAAYLERADNIKSITSGSGE